MMAILEALEPRKYLSQELISAELDEVNEILFIEKGEYKIGYEINKQ
jgi:hypothetical protein